MLQFHYCKTAFEFTMRYYDVWYISSHLLEFTKMNGYHMTEFLNKQLYDAKEADREMETEIKETLFASKEKLTHTLLFDQLKTMLNNERIKEVGKAEIERVAVEYNERVYANFIFGVKNDELRLKADKNYKSDWLTTHVINGAIYYCVTERPRLLDTKYLPDYYRVVSLVLDDFKEVLNKYINLFETGKISIETKEPEKIKTKSKKKLKVNLSVREIVYLFMLLRDLKPSIFIDANNTDLANFISENFTAKTTGESGIGPRSVAKAFYEIEKADANFWVAALKSMRGQALEF